MIPDNNIKKYRIEKGITQTCLSSLTGISLAMIQALEQGNRKLYDGSVRNLIRISGVLRVDPMDLLDWQVINIKECEGYVYDPDE